MDLSPEERAKMEAEWARGNKWGAGLARKKALATLVSSAVFGACVLPGVLLVSVRLALVGFILGIPLAMFVRKKMMPGGQFGN